MQSPDRSVSVLIPNFDWAISGLVKALHKQLTDEDILFEIICFDDAQESDFHERNLALNELPNVHYEINKVPLSRAQNRNALGELAQYEYVLFLDGDAGLQENDSFVKNYLKHAKPNQVVCGGTGYAKNPPTDPNKKLRYIYGVSREQVAATERQNNPWNGFSAFNFLMPKTLFSEVQFNEALSEYGHEDTLFGNDLKYRCIPILHIENRALHLGLDSNDLFLEKTRKAVVNLRGLIDAGLIDEDVKLYAWYARVRKLFLQGFFSQLYNNRHSGWERNLCSENPNLRLYDLYKLCYLCSLPVNHTAPPKRKI